MDSVKRKFAVCMYVQRRLYMRVRRPFRLRLFKLYSFIFSYIPIVKQKIYTK